MMRRSDSILGAALLVALATVQVQAQATPEKRLGLGSLGSKQLGVQNAPKASPRRRGSATYGPVVNGRRTPIYGAWPYMIYRSEPYKSYPSPYVVEPRLGITYGFGPHWGIQLPVDPDPTTTYQLPSFRGVVRSPQYPAWLYAKGGGGAGQTYGVDLMRVGRFKAAGVLQAEGFKRGDDPQYPLHLAESLFALGKATHAELVLNHVLSQDDAYDVLPDDVAMHFPSREKYDERVQALDPSKTPLLAAYLGLFTSDAGGLEQLLKLMKANPKNEIYPRLYRRYLGRAFAGAKDPVPAPTKAGGAAKAPKS
ncbi:MAG: hypothetical protein AAF517_19145 [Planctomycetota bacterium]